MSEYHDAMITPLETIWDKGLVAQGGDGNIAKQIDGLDLARKRVLDIGCDLGGPDLVASDWLFRRTIARYGSQSGVASIIMISQPQSRSLVQSSG